MWSSTSSRVQVITCIARATVLMVLVACGGGNVSDGTGPVVPPVDTTTPPTGVQRGTITVRVAVDPADAGVASAVGLSVAGLTVRLVRSLSNDPVRTATTDADGSARFENLLEGVYNASVDRPLTGTERAALPATDRDASVFAGGITVAFAPPQREVTVTLVASRRGSLVISEIFTYRGPGYDPAYGYGTYLEVYNASDTTIFLDGVGVASTQGVLHLGILPNKPCNTFNYTARVDSTQLFLGLVYAFPGSGREFPILPGQAKVIAMDAMNHIAASPTTDQVNLSEADFEYHGDDADIDNPFVPNMLRVRAGTGVFGRGYPISPNLAYVLVLPSALIALDSSSLEPLNIGYFPAYLAPRSSILDVLSTVAISQNPEIQQCIAPFLAAVFERDVSTLGSFIRRQAIRRKSLGFTPSGIELLQRTHTSSRDLENAEPLRRSLNK